MTTEMRQAQKDKYCMILLHEVPTSSQIYTDRQQSDGCQGLGEENMGSYYLMETELQFGKIKKFCGGVMAIVAQ